MAVLLSDLQEGVLTLTLNRPASYNAFTRELALELQAALDQAASDDRVRAILLTGSGKAFCSGQDLSELVGKDAIAVDKILAEHFNPLVNRLRKLKKPVVAAVNGVAAGAGANIALACDIVVASAQASFVQAFAKIGLIPDSGGTWMLPRIVGWQTACALMMTGDKLSVQRAEELGIVYKVFDSGTFLDDAHRFTERLAKMPTTALGAIKTALNQSAINTFDEQLHLEDQLQRACSQTSDYREGVEAFLQKRAPEFTGK